MKKTALAAILFAGTFAFLAPRPAEAAWSVSISYFQQELSPYGRWYVTRRYGSVWCPSVVSAGWYPYLDGEWIYTDYGWTWVSYDPFGDDPFHYGTWVWIEPYRWCWVPGYVWAPAWVTWAWTDTYVGWAPVPPSLDITVAGYSGAAISAPQSSYVFVPASQFAETNIAGAHLPASQNAGILAHARRVTRFTVSGGIVHGADPPPAIIERASHRPVHRAGLAVAGHTIRPTAITSAHAGSASRFSIVAPAHERAVAQGSAAVSGHEKRIAHGTSPSGAEVRHERGPAIVEQPRWTPPPSAHVARRDRQGGPPPEAHRGEPPPPQQMNQSLPPPPPPPQAVQQPPPPAHVEKAPAAHAPKENPKKEKQ